ncbi:hypothetical protein BRC90_06820 [Halobacteriales archaeon QS_4_69_34]|nr:MAG: hypothetical protein BRC90_06820 [Halobacteriales archaeon QS_4_69_34]
MQKISVTLRDEQVAQLSDLVGDEYTDRSKAVRALIDRGLEYDDLETENDRLRAENRALIEQREEHDELVRYAEQHRPVMEREQERRAAPAWQRAKWWLLGER